MHKRENILDLTRQELVIGTSSITDATGNVGYKAEYVMASAQLRIAEALEKNNDILRARRAGFDAEDLEDGMNHFHLKHEKGHRLFDMQVLATSPEMAQTWIQLLNKFGQDLVESANNGRSMRFTAILPIQKAQWPLFSERLRDWNLNSYSEEQRVFLMAFQEDGVYVRYASPAALFQLGMACQQAGNEEGGQPNG